MLLNKISLRNYKNIFMEPHGLLLKNLNVFIGANGSGKSNLINSLEFLKNCISHDNDEYRTTSSFEKAINGLCGAKALCKSLSRPERLFLSYEFNDVETSRYGLKFDINLYVKDNTSKVTISEEMLSYAQHVQEEPFIYYRFHNRRPGDGVVSVWNDEVEKKSHFEHVENVPISSLGLLVLPDLLEDSKNVPQKTPVYKIRRNFIQHIRQWYFYNANAMNLQRIRTSESKIGSDDIFLAATGSNLAIVIENLIQQSIDFEERLNEAMKSILPETRRVRPVRTGLMTVNLEYHFSSLSECFYLNELSDGTVRMLCWATVLLSPVLPSLLVIDEPELGIHPAWMPILAEWIKRASHHTQVIVSTHSPDLLDNFSDCVENVYCFCRNTNKIQYSISNLKMDQFRESFAEGWQLGDLYRVGDPKVGGWPW